MGHKTWYVNRGREMYLKLLLAASVRATLKCHGGYTVTQADRGENQSMNNQPKYNKGDLT